MPESDPTSADAAPRGRLFIISGPSGVGKSTITERVVERTGATLSVSVTTRRPRQGETDGEDYLFVGADRFGEMIDREELLEWAEVHGNYYGTPAAPVAEANAAGKTVVLEIDVQGGLQVAQRRPDAVGVLIVPPSDDELRRRLTGRGTDDDDVVARRLAKARDEMEAARTSGRYAYEVINDNLDEAVERVVRIMQQENADYD